MQIQINKDFQEYKEDSWRGFSLKELLSLIAATGSSAAVVFVLYQIAGVPMTLAVYLAVPAAMPSLLTGFYRYQGMSFLKLIRERLWRKQVSILTYEAGELPAIGVDTKMRKSSKGKGMMKHGNHEQ